MTYTIKIHKLTGTENTYLCEAVGDDGKTYYRNQISSSASSVTVIADMKQKATDYLNKNFTSVLIDTSETVVI